MQVLILTSSGGTAHDAAAYALRDWLALLRPEVGVEVALYWHQWQFPGQGAWLDRVGQALAAGAAQALGVSAQQ